MAQNIQPHTGSVIVNEINIPQGIIFKNADLLSSANLWHKFIITNTESSTRNEILGAILDQVHPEDLIPVSFWRDKKGSYFLARNCGAAIKKICKDNLVVPSQRDSSRPYKISIILKFATTSEFKIDVQKSIFKVLSKRYDVVTRTLNLINFHEDPDLNEYCPLSQPKIMFFVLHLTKSLSPAPENYILSNNRIKLLNALEALSTSSANIKLIDLRKNLLMSFENLQQLKLFNLTELCLDGNPLCENVSVQDYVTNIRGIVKNLSILDGVPIKNGQLPAANKLFLCNMNGCELVNQFLEHYFFIYDSQNRKLIQELYHKNAIFSLNSMYLHAQLSSATTRLYKYNTLSRNLHKMADFSQNSKNVFKGNQQIANILCSLPGTEHDPYSFMLDLMYYTNSCAIIAISGAFRERPETLLESEKVYGFRRIFTLKIEKNSGLCYITNEMLHVHNALSWQILDCFKISKPDLVAPVIEHPIPQSEKDQQKFIETLKIITTLNSEWAKKCLEECNYELKKALVLFVDLYKQNRIPEAGFEKTKKHI